MRILALLLVFLAWNVSAHAANEARCNELGADCICSEPLDSSSITWENTYFANFGDTSGSDKQCRVEGQAGAAYSTNSPGNLTAQNATDNAAMFAALPAGHSVTYVPRSPTGGSSGSFGTRFTSGTDPFQRQGMRFYRYYSSDFRFTDETDPNCNSGKVAQLGYNGPFTGGPMWATGGSTFNDFAMATGWSADVDCCGPSNPSGQTGTPPSLASMKGHWIRYELYMDNNTTSGTTAVQAFMRDITADTAEVQVMDTTGDARFTGVHPSSVMIDWLSNNFRGANEGTPPGTCEGYFAHSYYLAAAWSTSAGQRIGAATEIEGGGGGSSAPRRFSPMNLRRAENDLAMVEVQP